jgi:16S rRNA C967 or C1407 C5-methylase (RsmB/RsmF family)
MRNEGLLVAHDNNPQRLKLVEMNCARLGITSVSAISGGLARAPGPQPEGRFDVGTNPGGAAEDPNASKEATLKRLEGRTPLEQFDRVLVDVPCSNTGVLRRRVDLRWRITLPEIQRLRKTQLELLDQAVHLLTPGGTLVYSTCSLEPDENREVIGELLSRRGELKFVRERLLVPFEDAVDGGYFACVKRT